MLARQGQLLFVVDVMVGESAGHCRLSFIERSHAFDSKVWMQIRVVGSLRKSRKVGPVLDEEHASQWRLWLWEGRPLSRVHWDLGEWL